MIAHPVLVDAALVVALVLLLNIARLRGRAVVHRGVLIGAIHAVWITVANPALGNACGSTPLLVLSALELPLRITFAGVCKKNGAQSQSSIR